MPAPAVVGVYVLAAVGTVAAGVAFKEFVYEPHIAPRVERWAEEFLAKRAARKRRKAGLAAVPVANKRSDDDGHGGDDGTTDLEGDGKSVYELESVVANEVRQWRSQVGAGPSTLRHRPRGTSSALDESNLQIPYSPLTPTQTHVLFDPADALTETVSSPTSTISSRVATPSPHSTLSHSAFRVPPPRAPPTPEPSVHASSPSASPFPTPAPLANPFEPASTAPPNPFELALASPHHVPSLSLSHPLDLASEHDLELLSASSRSSRPASPFSDSDFRAGSHEQFYSFASSPRLGVLSASEGGSDVDADADELERWSSAGSESEIGGSESSWASAGLR
ncbi:hypothetical protein DFH07DRAFT_1059858 [Mycena maculata]|uniref:Uncharacterized protein n=1 Tax=Mycena maculata TaxID=230809 RepID=A0AAD7JF57_9AGAR|nr:hypothetical protein DFH07DRAFT_1059858 [Mycena maculata]